ncbi:MAG: hypothetical protein ACE5RT_06460 [Nitrosopumilaceae archaeon]
MSDYSNIQNYRNLIALAIEKSLAEIGFPILENVQKRLADNYNCEFSDCLDHPEYLNKILNEIFGDSYFVIVQSIQQNLNEFSEKELVDNFLKTLQK